MKYIVGLCLVFITGGLCAQDYNVALIPDSLKEKANAVKRMEELHVIIKSIDRVVIKHKYAITILNEEGAENAVYSNWYNKLRSLSDISGYLYDASGKKLKSVKKRDIEDSPSEDGFSLMNDDREKKHNFYYNVYPYTVEYEDEQEYNGIYFLPSWRPVDDEKFAVQQSSFIVETPVDYKLRTKQFNYTAQPVITSDKIKSYSWEVKNVKAIKDEYFQPPFNEVTTCVYIAPTEFSIGGYTGNMDSWLNLGKFNVDLNKGRDELPDNVKQDIHKLVDNVSDKKEKVKLLYQYLQNNTRYISVQLGIGGWQPFDAKYVAAKKYGDCKALSNYMVSILKEAGIKANYVVIKSGERVTKGLWEDFPSPYFNHIVTCVPDAKDTLWLECTSQTEPAGFMGSFTGNRKALLIADDGGHVVNTPVYKADDNLQLRTIEATIDSAGNLIANVNTHFTGIQQELQHSLIHDASKDQRDKYLNRTLNLPTYQVDKSDYKEQKNIIPSVDEYLHVISPNYASLTGKRLFIQPNLFNKSSLKLPADEVRKFDIEYSSAFKDVDTINIVIPAGYTPEAAPKEVSINNKFGTYDISFKINNNKIQVIRTQIRNVAQYPASEYPGLVKYYDDVYKADRSRMVFVKKE